MLEIPDVCMSGHFKSVPVALHEDHIPCHGRKSNVSIHVPKEMRSDHLYPKVHSMQCGSVSHSQSMHVVAGV